LIVFTVISPDKLSRVAVKRRNQPVDWAEDQKKKKVFCLFTFAAFHFFSDQPRTQSAAILKVAAASAVVGAVGMLDLRNSRQQHRGAV
jgi:hypothetical protein